jgi:hypothetical protein
VISSIVHIAHDYTDDDEPWPIEIEDHDGVLHAVDLKMGEVGAVYHYLILHSVFGGPIQPFESCGSAIMCDCSADTISLSICADVVLRERQVPARAAVPAEGQVLRVHLCALPARGSQDLELFRRGM